MKTVIFRVCILISSFVGVLPSAYADTMAELQWVFCDKHLPDVISILNLPEPPVKIPQKTYYLETVNSELEKHDVFIKFKQLGRKKVKSSVKVRFEKYSDIPEEYLESEDISCERDVYLDSSRWACAIKNKSETFKLSKSQRHFLKENGVRISRLEDLYLLGPMVGTTSDIDDATNYEEMKAPEGRVVGEFSVRVDAKNARAMQKIWTDRMQRADLVVCKLQAGKREIMLQDLWKSGSYKKYAQP